MRKILPLVLFTFIIASCFNDQKQVINKKHLYTIELPGYMNEATDLSEDASLQYQSIPNDIYVMVFDEPKENLENAIFDNGLESMYSNDLDGYARLLNDGIDENVEYIDEPEFTDKQINGLKAKVLDFSGITDGLRVYWMSAYLEGRNNYYQINIWTSLDKKDKLYKDMEAMIESFTETDKSKK